MKKALLFLPILFCFIVNAQDPIFNSSMSISSFGIVDSPFGEEVDKIIDGDVNTKFLDFDLDDGMGFTVDLGGDSYMAKSIEITTANDFEVRDPMNFEVLGSNDGVSFTSIDSGEIICLTDRLFTRSYDINNDESYSYYRINYTNACDPSGGTGIPSIQLAETQLYTEILGISDTDFSNKFSLYPNPNNGSFKLNYNGTEPITKAFVIDLNGRIIQQINVEGFETEKEISLNHVNSGIYFLSISTQNNTTNQKLIIN